MHDFLDFPGEMAGLIRGFDWSGTQLGPIETWPQSLKTITGFLLRSPVPIVLLWASDGVMIYNDAYSIFAGARHPDLLGMNVLDAWPEVAAFNAHVMQVGLTGGTLSYKDQELTLYRHGQGEQVWMNLDYSPVLGEDGRPAGVIAIVVETTERVRADRRMAAEQRRQQQLLRQMPGFVGVLAGPQHVYEYVNDAYVKISGRSDFLGRSVREVFPDLQDQGFFELLDQVYASGQAAVVHGMEMHLHGSEDAKFIDIVYEPIRDDSGMVSGIFVGGYEVTQVLQGAAALRISEERYRSLFESMGEGFGVIEAVATPGFARPDYRYVAVNPAYAAISGIPDLAGRNIRELFPDDWHAQFALYDQVLEAGKPVRVEWERNNQGQVIEIYGFPLHGGASRRIGVIYADVTPRRRLEQQRNRRDAELKQMNETLEQRIAERSAQLSAQQAMILTFFTHSTECHAVLAEAANGSFCYEEVNPATLTLYKKTRDQVIGLTTDQVLGADPAGELNAHLAACLRDGVPYRYERAQGHEIVEAVASPVFAEAEETRRVVVTARDVTQRRSLEEQLRQAQKMEAVGQLTGGIAHDFNNMLVGITGNLELLELRMAQGRLADAGRFIRAAQDASRRAAALTQRLLAFSRRQTLDPKPTDVNRLIESMADLIRRTVGPGVTLEVVGAGGLWLTRIDPSQLESAILNLAINARDALPDGGRMTIETANKWLDERAAPERDLAPGQYVSVCVSDNGTGMTPEVVARAFDPFFTTKPLGQGTGLGLSMVHGFVRQSGGQVRIYSELGFGTTMCLYLPRHVGDMEMPEAPGTALGADSGQGETVLVIDDEPTVRMLIIDVLGDAGYQVIEAHDGPTGLKILQSSARVDLLITDVGLPGGMNGRQVADAARMTNPELSVLFITGYAENAVVGNGHLAPGMQVITKPFEMAMLREKVAEMLRR